MDFALKQMKAMGWSEGKGLGVYEAGIVKPIKPLVQTDTRGLGFTITDSIQLKNQWWNDAYNVASQGMKAEYKITSIGVIVKPKQPNSCNEDDKTYNKNFVSAGVLVGDLYEDNSNKDETESVPDKCEKKKKKSKTKNRDKVTKSKEVVDEKRKSLDFNRIFENTKGLTCHKAARLGIKMNAKLKRLEEQEMEFVKTMQSGLKSKA